MIEILKALLLGIVQGITEWLPVSSTGHMILVDEFVALKDVSKEFFDLFLVAIQLGSILAVCVLFFHKLNPISRKKNEAERKAIWRLWGRVLLGCVPAGVVGVLLDDWISARLYGFLVVALALLVYGILFVVLERRRAGASMRIQDVSEIGARDAILIGCFQVLSLVPGTSRSGSTILGASLIGVGRTAAAEFSFFMALPVMAGATLLRGAKFCLSGTPITPSEVLLLIVGTVSAFFISLVAIRFLMEFVKKRGFEAFGWYRIALALVLLIYWMGFKR